MYINYANACAFVHRYMPMFTLLGSAPFGLVRYNCAVVNIVMLMLMFGCCVFCYVIVTVTVLLHLFGG